MFVSNLKRALSITMSAALILTLAACQSNKNNNKTESTDSTPVTLTWYNFLDPIKPDQSKVTDALNAYLQKKINATVDLKLMSYDDYATKMPVIISSGQNYDICFAASWAGCVVYQNEVKVGAFYKMTPQQLQKYAPETWKTLPQELWNTAKISGSIYGFPIYKEEGQQYGYMLNTDLAKQYNLDYSNVKTWKDLGPVLEKLHQQAPTVVGLRPINVWNLANYSITAGANVGEIVVPKDKTFSNQKESTVFNQFATPEFKSFCETMHDWYKAGYFPQNPQSYTSANSTADAKANHLLAFEIAYTPDYEKTYSQTIGHNFTFLPATPTLYVGASNFQCISANSKNPTRAMELLDLVNTDLTVGNLIHHGIEGTHYTKAGNQIHTTDAQLQSYGYAFAWEWGSIFNQTWSDSYPTDINDAYKKFNNSCVANPLAGYNFDPSNVTNQVASITNIWTQYFNPLTMGVMDPASGIPAFVNALNQNGASDVMKEEQKQINSFVSQGKSSK